MTELPRAGEEFAERYEVARLAAAGHEQLAAKVERVSRTRGDAVGFDILSFETDGRERLVEVKTTRYGKYTPFFLSRNEVRTSDAFFSFENARVCSLYPGPCGPTAVSIRLSLKPLSHDVRTRTA